MSFYVLTAVKPQNEGIKLTFSCADKKDAPSEVLLLTENSYRKKGAPIKGTILSEEDMESYRLSHRRYHAVRRALSILSASDNSERMLYRKLRSRGILHEDACFAVAYAKKNCLIREREQLERLILRLANEKLYGRARIVRALNEKGYRITEINEILASCTESGTVDFSENLRALYEKKMPKDDSQRKKLAYSYGYHTDCTSS